MAETWEKLAKERETIMRIEEEFGRRSEKAPNSYANAEKRE
jgi:hypothetical protein